MPSKSVLPNRKRGSPRSAHVRGTMESKQRNPRQETQRHLVEAVLAYVAFCGLSVLSRFFLPIFPLVIVSGIAFPLLWAKFKRGWSSIGFTRRNLGQTLLWGLGAGLVTSLIGFLTAEERSFAPMLGLQLGVGIPIWLLIMSPFQEFFFRGWMQPRFQSALGKWGGLLGANLCFTLWHLFPPFVGTSTSSLPVNTLPGMVGAFGVGLVFGYSFQRTDNIVAPWLAHALGGIALVSIGAMSFIQYTP